MAVTAEQLARGLYTVLQHEPKHQQKALHEFVAMVEEQGLMNLLPHVVRYLEYYLERDQKREQVHITLARKHDDHVLQAIVKRVETEGKPEVIVSIDESIGGGFIAQHNNVVYDGSVKGQLQRVKAELAK